MLIIYRFILTDIIHIDKLVSDCIHMDLRHVPIFRLFQIFVLLEELSCLLSNCRSRDARLKNDFELSSEIPSNFTLSPLWLTPPLKSISDESSWTKLPVDWLQPSFKAERNFKQLSRYRMEFILYRSHELFQFIYSETYFGRLRALLIFLANLGDGASRHQHESGTLVKAGRSPRWTTLLMAIDIDNKK